MGDLDCDSLVPTGKFCLTAGSLQIERYISGSNVNMIMRYDTSLFSCKDVTMRILNFELLLDTIHQSYDQEM